MVSDNHNSDAWYKAGVGERLIDAERQELANILPRLYGYHLVFMGDPGLISLVQPSLIQHQILVEPQAEKKMTTLSPLPAHFSELPLRSDSVDVIVLSHILEHIPNPHDVLREAHRVLIPEGTIVITGFNPISCWGGWHAIQKWRKTVPLRGKLLSSVRLKDWLKLLNFQITGGHRFCFRPPIHHDKLYQKLEGLERWGQRVWPLSGGAYSLVATKRVIPLTPIRPKLGLKQKLWATAPQAMPKPTTSLVKNKKAVIEKEG